MPKGERAAAGAGVEGEGVEVGRMAVNTLTNLYIFRVN